FGFYNGPEEVIDRTACYTEINVTSNYAPVATTTLQVVDEGGAPVKATVEFKIYNYSQFYTAVTKESDDNGSVSLTTGHGDMIAWASKDGKFGYVKFTAGKDNNIKIVLDKAAGHKATEQMDIIPPVERNTVPELTPEQVSQNAARFAYEDSIRNAYVATFPTAEDAAKLADEIEHGAEYIIPLIAESRGNYAAITSFLRSTDKGNVDRAVGLLCAISQKDRRDISLEVLNDHFKNTPDCDAEGVNEQRMYEMYVLNPRVSNEMLTPYKGFFANVISQKDAQNYKNNPELWADWCRNNITVEESWNPIQLCMSPKGVWEYRTADAHSRDIFFVSAARSMGIAARIDAVTGKTQYFKDGKWCDVNFSADAANISHATGRLVVDYTPNEFNDDPRYSAHFTISKIVDGKLQIQSYPFNAGLRSVVGSGLTMDSGDYLVITGTRMANGGVLANLDFVQVPAGGTAKMQMSMRESKDELQVIGNFNSENLYYDIATDQSRSILSSTGRGYYIIALIDPNSEPTNHFLRDVMPYKEQFEKWGQKMVLLFKDKSAASRFKADDFPSLPSTVVWGTDIDDKISGEIITNMKLKSPNRPVILVADTFNRIVFMSQGYSIGLGEQLVKVINQLSKK
ncbi:MAG: transglutaminase domain-containing protein, partial [Bacteroidaceae bacterium]|nr:transglutaminase domain-containing protein [Bacteroidaceae bacterium]